MDYFSDTHGTSLTVTHGHLVNSTIPTNYFSYLYSELYAADEKGTLKFLKKV